MTELLAGRIALVTGASTGIGESIAKVLATDGAHVVLVARREGELMRVARDIRVEGGTATTVAGDLSDNTFVTSLVGNVEAQVGAVDVLVNNAGVANLQPAHELRQHLLDEEIQINFRVPALLCAATLPHMREQKWGRIVNVSSEAGITALAGMAAYSSTKRALIALTEVIQAENKEYGVKAWALCPSMVDTPGGDDRGMADRTLFLTSADVAEALHNLLHQSENVMMGPEIRIRTQRNPWVNGSPTDWSSDLVNPTKD